MTRQVIILLAGLMACAPEDGEPGDLLPRETFTRVLTQAQLVEARLRTEVMMDSSMARAAEKYYDEMFERESVTREAFSRTFDWYAAHPDRMKAVYDDVLLRLQQQADSTAR